MRLFRYRPFSPLLFKELRYREMYLASAAELNDPLDLNAQIDFAPHGKEAWEALCAFLCKVSVGAHGRIELIPTLSKLMAYDRIGKFLETTLSLAPGQCLTKKTLFEAIHKFYHESASEFSPLDGVYAQDLCDAVDSVLREVLGNSAAACFSETNNDFMMWSHYSSGHSGVCLEFEVAKATENTCRFPFESPVPFQGKNLVWTMELQPVTYTPKLSMLPFYKFFHVFYEYGDIDLVNLSKPRWHGCAKGISDLFLEKLSPWSTEKEWRIVQVHFKETIPEERIYNYTSEALKGVFFGARMTDAAKRRVREALIWSGKPKFYQAVADGSQKVKFEPDEEQE
jgi:Protein of unknown function (DUF2971)